MDNNQLVMLGAALGTFGLLLAGYLRNKRRFQAKYLLDALIGTAAALPALQALQVEVGPGETQITALLLGLMAGLAGKLVARESIKQIESAMGGAK